MTAFFALFFEKTSSKSIVRFLLSQYLRGLESWSEKPFHKALLNNQLSQTIGGGIGQSRLAMLLLRKAHIGKVQQSICQII